MPRLSKELCEEIGAHIGDGSMGVYDGRYIVSFCGNKEKDYEYVKRIAGLYSKLYSIRPKIRFWSGVVGFQIFSKSVLEFKASLGLPIGKKIRIDIPAKIKESSKACIASCLRGIFDTDGTVYLENKNHDIYPRIQLKVASKELAESVTKLLNEKFNIRATHYWRSENKRWRVSHYVECRGRGNLRAWMKLIGFSNSRNLNKVSEYYKRSKRACSSAW